MLRAETFPELFGTVVTHGIWKSSCGGRRGGGLFFGGYYLRGGGAGTDVILLEKGSQFLSRFGFPAAAAATSRMSVSMGGSFTTRFPRGEQALIAPFQRFQASDTVAWFEARGIKLKTESDGRMFPVTDSSQTIIDCLMRAAEAAGVKLAANCGVQSVAKREHGGFCFEDIG